MTILVAPDKFKGSLSAAKVCSAIEEGLHLADHSTKVILAPLADGGEGTCDLLLAYSGGHEAKAMVRDPLFREMESTYGISNDGKTAFVEMAKASGLQLLKQHERNPMETSSIGTGELIADALRRGVKHVIVGIGGSATNDAGIGMATALGFSFLSASGKILQPTGKNLIHIHSISRSDVSPLINNATFTFLCDVNNPLFGPTGAAFVYGPQKGATKEQVEDLDRGLNHFAALASDQLGSEANFPAAGAAGGTGAGARVFLNAEVRNGFDFVSAYTGLEEKIRQADLVITGEGKIDKQSLSGKVVSGVAALCQKHKKRCIAFAGRCDLSDKELQAIGIEEVHTLIDEGISESEAISDAFDLLRERTNTFLKNSSA